MSNDTQGNISASRISDGKREPGKSAVIESLKVVAPITRTEYAISALPPKNPPSGKLKILQKK